jgi:hypothetical protein
MDTLHLRTPFYISSSLPYCVYQSPSENSKIAYICDKNELSKAGAVVQGTEREGNHKSWIWLESGLGFVNPAETVQIDTNRTHISPIYVIKQLTPTDDIITSVQWCHPEAVVGFLGAFEFREIVYYYWYHCQKVNLNPVITISQAILETNYFTSDWFQKHNNPAGIGVTGEQGKGCSFDTLEYGIKSHIGRLLAYRIPPGNERAVQKLYIQKALFDRALPATYRGMINSVSGLNMTWAMVDYYADSICKIANRILNYDT